MDICYIPCKWFDCDEAFESMMELNNHISNHLEDYHTESNGFICRWRECEFKIDCIEELTRHVYYHGYYTNLLMMGQLECEVNPDVPSCGAEQRKGDIVPERKYDYNCEWLNCSRSFNSIIEFQDHIDHHAEFDYEMQKSPEEKAPKINCNWFNCKRRAENKYRFMEHVRKHSLKKYVACFHCGEVFRTKGNLFDHLRRQTKNNTQKFQCAECFKYFSTGKLLRAHVVRHINCFKCTQCDMTCSSSYTLAKHVRYRHLKEKPVKCTMCSYRCVSIWDLRTHMNHVHLKVTHQCNYDGCNYVVRCASKLKRHILEEHKNLPIIYMCHCCDKAFKTSMSITAHMKKQHDFKLPPGHKRFKYRPDENGYYRLQTVRIEIMEVANQSTKDKSKLTARGTTTAADIAKRLDK